MQAHAAVGEKDEFITSRQQFDSLVEQLRGQRALAMNHSELESMVETEGRDVLRALFQDHLDLRAGREVAVERVVGADGMARTHRRAHCRPLMTVFGPVEVRRIGYGLHGQTSLHPMDAELNLPPEKYSHGVRLRVAEEAARGSYDEAIAAVERNTGADVPKRQAEQLAARAAQDFEVFYGARRAKSAAEQEKMGSLVVLTSDGKGIPTRLEYLRKETRRAAENEQHKLTTRLSRGEKRNRKRMATVAAVYTIEPHVRTPESVLGELKPLQDTSEVVKRPKPEGKRVWACIQKEPEAVLRDAFGEAIRRDPLRKKTWVALVDGNKHQLDLMQKLAAEFAVTLIIVLDFIHVLEYLWKAAWAFHNEGDPAAEQWVHERMLKVLRGNSSEVAAGIRRSATLRGLKGAGRKAADTSANYLLKYRDYLHYDEYLADGLPIATGVAEGACRHLVRDRHEVTGARWSVPGAEAVLRLRSLRSSGDFEAYWRFHLKQELARHHDQHYADAKAPRPSQSAGQPPASPLRLVPSRASS